MQKQIEYTEILVGLRKIIRAINLESKQIQKEHGISIPQLLCLNYLKNQPEYKSTSKELKAYMNLNASTISGIVGRLEKKGYLARVPVKEDKRVSSILLTGLGLKIIDQIPPLMHDKLTHKLQQLPASKLNDIQGAISLLIEFMGTESLDASPVIMVQDPSDPI
ncbi:MAG: MarR family transcriptional regulator [Crocinitomicaceae bacterium]|nr:MarR family transcriptional regulator [Crocinitomicaceae bacterium]